MTTGEPKPTFQVQLDTATEALSALEERDTYDRDILLGRHGALLSLAATGLEVGEHNQQTAIGIKLAATRRAAAIAETKGDELLSKDFGQTAKDYEVLLELLKPAPKSATRQASRVPAKTTRAKTSGAKGRR